MTSGKMQYSVGQVIHFIRSNAASGLTDSRQVRGLLLCLFIGSYTVPVLGAEAVVQAEAETRVKIETGISAFESGDFVQAAEIFSVLGQQSNGEALYYLGRMFELGAGLRAPNIPAAVEQYLASSEAGELRADNRLGLLYVSGESVLQSYALAEKFFKRAAVGELPDGQYNYGNLFDLGLGVAKDRKVAFDWYEKAASGGHMIAAMTLGEAYLEGLAPLPVDEKKAYDHHLIAANLGAGLSLHRVGQFLAAGSVVAEDKVKAHMYLNLAAARGLSAAVDERDALGRDMTVAEVAAAQTQAQEWRPQVDASNR